MATQIKDNRIKVSDDPMIEDIVNEMGLSEDKVEARSFDHCRTKEDLKFEILSIYLHEGRPREEAEKLSSRIAADLWNDPPENEE